VLLLTVLSCAGLSLAGTTSAHAAFTGNSKLPGLGSGRIWTIAVSPTDANVQLAATDQGVYRSEDAGATWTALSDGLPSEPFYPAVLRDALTVDDADPAGIYFGTRSGEVYASADEGDSWRQIAAHLPDVLCVRAAVLP
jgi:photosystem II stability/assembly factor-like uncharacterized protein